MKIKPRSATTIGFFSAKGGVGKTTISINAAYKLSQDLGGNVLLVDANLTAPNLSTYLGDYNPEDTLHHVIAGEIPIEESIKELKGLDLIYGSLGYGEVSHRIDLQSYLQDLRSEYKAILIDTAPSLGNEAISAIRACDEMIVITTPDYPSVASSLQTFRAAEEYKVTPFGAVVNKVLDEDFEVPTKDIKKALDWPILSDVPFDLKVPESAGAGLPLIEYAPDSPASEELKKLARKLREHLSED